MLSIYFVLNLPSLYIKTLRGFHTDNFGLKITKIFIQLQLNFI